ncbi:MAG: chalcone isomerase family protein [Gemmatimonadetes bacterium]|nr:chalcone isomerase family protein [Gemmatimonadota bacterium]MBK7786761.1 chalcone isomerase family protein [Gemmatimonadota bacterium]
MLLLLTTLLSAQPAALPATAAADTGRTMNGVTMPATIDVGGTTLSLNGMALRKKFIIKVYVAGLYIASASRSADEILGADAPRQMVMHFISGHGTKDKVCGAWNDGLKDNTPGASAELKQQFVDLCGMMQDLKNGESLTITYVPGTGTTINIAGTDKGTVAGKDFADAILRCWIGPKPGPGEGFKKNLLGQS